MNKLSYNEWLEKNPFAWFKELEKDIVDTHDISIVRYVEILQQRAYERYINGQ